MATATHSTPVCAVTVTVTVRPLPGRSRPSVLLSLASTTPGRPLVWGRRELAALEAALDSVDTSSVEAMIIQGADGSFGAGADLEMIRVARNAAEAESLARYGYSVFAKVSASELPTFALITGPALGGGLELALHADCRLARSDAHSLGLPETRLGLVPGWGGAYLLPHLVGPDEALKIIAFDPILGARTRNPQTAADIGLIDAVLAEEGWEDSWPRWVAARLDRLKSTTGAPGQQDDSQWKSAVQRVREIAGHRFRGAAPAVSAAIDLVESAAHSTPEKAMEAAVKAFGRLRETKQAQASLYAQRLIAESRKRSPGQTAGSPVPIHRGAVVGAGLMASQLAFLLAKAGISVRMTDIDEERLKAGVRRVRDKFEALAQKGTMSSDEALDKSTLVTAEPDIAGLADSEFVIEAVYEDIQVKRQVFGALERVVAPGSVLATNTSSLSISQMASGLEHPERVVGFHIFNPVEVLRLVEVIPGQATNAPTLATAQGLARALNRVPVQVADTPGFAVNRLLTRLIDVVLADIDSGEDPLTANYGLDRMGLPMTPLQLLDLVGPAVQLHVCHTMHAAYPRRFGISAWLTAIVDAKLSRVLSDEGLLTADAQTIHDELRNNRSGRRQAHHNSTPLYERVLDALAEEVRIMLEEGVVGSAEEVDLCMLLGANYPPYLGGLTPHLDTTGASIRANGTAFHPPLSSAP